MELCAAPRRDPRGRGDWGDEERVAGVWSGFWEQDLEADTGVRTKGVGPQGWGRGRNRRQKRQGQGRAA